VLTPVRLIIPSINLNTDIEKVGLTRQGAVDVPVGRLAVGWFNLGPYPGEDRQAIITGHYGFWRKVVRLSSIT
jgi:hypothetical protein